MFRILAPLCRVAQFGSALVSYSKGPRFKSGSCNFSTPYDGPVRLYGMSPMAARLTPGAAGNGPEPK